MHKSPTRFGVWRSIVWRPLWIVVAIVITRTGDLDSLVSWVVSEERAATLPRPFDFLEWLADRPWWAWTIVGLIILCGVILEGAFREIARRHREFDSELREAQSKLDTLLGTVQYSLVLDNLKVYLEVQKDSDTGVADVQIGLMLSNAGDITLRYEVPFVSLTISGQQNPDPHYLNTGGVIRADKPTIFRIPVVSGVPLDPLPSGVLECEILYGPAASEMLYRMKKRMSFVLRRGVDEKYPSTILMTYDGLDEDEPISPR